MTDAEITRNAWRISRFVLREITRRKIKLTANKFSRWSEDNKLICECPIQVIASANNTVSCLIADFIGRSAYWGFIFGFDGINGVETVKKYNEGGIDMAIYYDYWRIGNIIARLTNEFTVTRGEI